MGYNVVDTGVIDSDYLDRVWIESIYELDRRFINKYVPLAPKLNIDDGFDAVGGDTIDSI